MTRAAVRTDEASFARWPAAARLLCHRFLTGRGPLCEGIQCGPHFRGAGTAPSLALRGELLVGDPWGEMLEV